MRETFFSDSSGLCGTETFWDPSQISECVGVRKTDKSETKACYLGISDKDVFRIPRTRYFRCRPTAISELKHICIDIIDIQTFSNICSDPDKGNVLEKGVKEILPRNLAQIQITCFLDLVFLVWHSRSIRIRASCKV